MPKFKKFKCDILSNFQTMCHWRIYFFRYRLISIGYTSQDCLGLDLQSLTSISATIFVVSKNWLFLLHLVDLWFFPILQLNSLSMGKITALQLLKIINFLYMYFFVPGWTSSTFWSIVSKYRFRKFSLHILPKHFRDPPTLIWHFPISYVLCIFQFSLSIPGGDKARSVQSVLCQWRKKSLRRIFSPR